MTATNLLPEAEELLSNNVRKLVPIDSEKKPALEKWTHLRDKQASLEQIKLWFSSDLTVGLGIVLDKSWFVFDYDGLGEHRIKTRILPRAPKEIQDAFRITTHTKTPHGGHTLFRINPEDYPQGIKEKECWNLIGNGLQHNQVVLLSQNKYLIERGPGYEPIRGINCLVMLSKDSVTKLLTVIDDVEKETKVISSVINVLLPFYKPTNRDKVVFSLAGYLPRSIANVEAMVPFFY